MDSPRLNPSDLPDMVRAVVRDLFPELTSGLLVSRLARVVATSAEVGPVTNLEPRLTVDVQPLAEDGSDDTAWPVITSVRVGVPWAGPLRAAASLPVVGAIVRLSWLYGRTNLPFADPYTAEGFELPSCGKDWVVKLGDTELRVTDAGEVRITAKAGQRIIIDGDDVQLGGDGGLPLLNSGFAAHTHTFPDGVTGPAQAVAGSATTRAKGR